MAECNFSDTTSNIFEVESIVARRTVDGKNEYLVKWKYHTGAMWTKLHNLQCLEAILNFECFKERAVASNELKACTITTDGQVFIEWNNPISSHLLRLPVDVVERVRSLLEEEVFIRVGNYDVRPSGPHPPGLLELLCGFRDLRHMQGCLKPVELEMKSNTTDSDITFKYFITALQQFVFEKCIYNNCEVTLYSKVEPILWMATKDMPGVKVECGFNVRGTKYKEDIVVVRKNVQGEYIPFFIIELKPLIHSDINGCSLPDVNECLLYGKYIIEKYKSDEMSLLCALTDAQCWHIFDYNGIGIDKYFQFSNGKNYFLMHGYLRQLIQSKFDELS
ncbi:PREDICTED: uncharacterized protein LOC109583953 [Amphimedon queenslandica]|uniref:Chromo domain-containing protein n=1 Tax=Amphimedon queenslandica TaxID=400682 RepID=A0A1X7UC55_AMPQE|nr:PREDICTED: uncharacterized protein LOC109583953 [Amphimedon queenslandica]|eukprot:XP_019855058.1 PREDICTED: uncharacterized protein LOC109583953 [Amphimedon queenslandica]